VTEAFSFTNAASLIIQFMLLVNQHFCFLPFQTLWNLLCTVTADVDLWNHSTHLVFSTWDTILTTSSVGLQVERCGNSSGTNYRLDHITYINAFSFYSSAFWFMSNVTVKWYIFHVYTLNNTDRYIRSSYFISIPYHFISHSYLNTL
jgi:hypothetical protein